MITILIQVGLSSGAFYYGFQKLPAPANGWRGGLGRFLQGTMLAMLAWIYIGAFA